MSELLEAQVILGEADGGSGLAAAFSRRHRLCALAPDLAYSHSNAIFFSHDFRLPSTCLRGWLAAPL